MKKWLAGVAAAWSRRGLESPRPGVAAACAGVRLGIRDSRNVGKACTLVNEHTLSQSDPSATINYTLDNLGRATTISNSISSLTPTVAFNQAFDTAGNRTELKATIGSTLDFKNTYQYDALNRLVETIQQGQSGGNAVTSKHVTQSYNALSQRTGTSRYQSTGTSNPVASTSFSFDTANRLTNIVHAQGSTTLSSYAYTYDCLSRIASITSSIDGLSTYAYDISSQLTGADHSSQTDESYDYDDNGNRDSSGYTTSSNNRTTAAPGFTYTYDDEGNRASRTDTSTGAVQETTWDYRNRLTKAVSLASSGGAITQQVDYEYDANNRMVKRVLDADGAGSGSPTTQYWAYDQGINALVEFDGSSGSDLSHRYLWSNQVDELFADEQVSSPSTAGNTLWAISDHLNSIRDIADYNESTGVTTIANHRTLTATGTVVAETNVAVDLLFAFTGKQLDNATRLQHNLFRWYDSELGQWISEDPMDFAAGDENLRRYVLNTVISRLDPLGLDDWGSSFQDHIRRFPPVSTPPVTRALTAGELKLLSKVFGAHLDTSNLQIGTVPFLPWVSHNTMTPRYTPWFPPANYRTDFSTSNTRHFIHEMTHVLQSQNGNYNWIDGPYFAIYHRLDYTKTYKYNLADLGSPLYTFNFEQQADIVADYFTGAIPIANQSDAWKSINGFQTQLPPLDCSDSFGSLGLGP